MSDTDVAAWAALLRVHAALVPLIDRELQAACGLPLTWYDVLLELNSAPDRRLNMSDLGDVALVSRTRASRVVDQMVAAGLVTREPNPDDRRSAYATISEAGRARLRAAAPAYLASIRRHFTSRMTPAESATVAAALRKVLADPPGDSDQASAVPPAV
ncbi:MarR family winged helix-turn-helix transcriptional regulator [Actinoplanes subtropicus]|uniref:MarR family winged helix-turn-helix transcriptional regulator n=1 Tax=Actinoplanes subtropicus TaxID=543632 RepID=UPI000555DBE0|nr:MarR family transcriptional regulator [Actinoplanes subtropicus]